MSTVTCAIVDDEPIARLGLRHALAGHAWLQCVGEAAHVDAAVAMVDSLTPELLFLDIAMPGGSGLDVLRRITHRPRVIFTTAFAEHAVEAFELGAIDYLLKPFGEERLTIALDRVRASIGGPNDLPTARWDEVTRDGPMRRLFVRSGSAVIPVPIESIVHLQAWGDYVLAFTAGAKYVLHVPLHRLEARLDPTHFLRVHRAHIVSVAHVAKFRPQRGGGLVALLTTGTEVPVSRAHAKAVRALGV
ncbi:MAG: LytTR family DNA-binding domain-containing protein [Gemmatimonadaceae bacterium]|nr:LytTR family DNA-binding domain-containing protein [Gemmatimonadaceae bacterium]